MKKEKNVTAHLKKDSQLISSPVYPECFGISGICEGLRHFRIDPQTRLYNNYCLSHDLAYIFRLTCNEGRKLPISLTSVHYDTEGTVDLLSRRALSWSGLIQLKELGAQSYVNLLVHVHSNVQFLSENSHSAISSVKSCEKQNNRTWIRFASQLFTYAFSFPAEYSLVQTGDYLLNHSLVTQSPMLKESLFFPSASASFMLEKVAMKSLLPWVTPKRWD